MLLFFLASCINFDKENKEKDFSLSVNPFIGTAYNGNTYPGVQVPFGMVQLSPDNGFSGLNRTSGYYYADSVISGFSHTHLSGVPIGDLYDISFMPITNVNKKVDNKIGVYSSFSHDNEKAYAGYYSVLLKDYNISVELTATERCGIQRYKFPKSKASIFLNLKKDINWNKTKDSYIEVIDSCTIKGYRISSGIGERQKVYFVTRFSKPFISYNINRFKQNRLAANKSCCLAEFKFDMLEGEEIVVVTSISGVSLDGAMKNMQKETPHNNFDTYLNDARKKWNEELSQIEITDAEYDDKIKFYTSLYHTKLAPIMFSDVDSTYLGLDKKVHKSDGWINYSNFMFWSTYRAHAPLLTYTNPDRVNDMIKSFLAYYDQMNRLPNGYVWGNEVNIKIGYHVVTIIVDAYLKNIGDFDYLKALKASVAMANADNYTGLKEFKDMGYVCCNKDNDINHGSWALSKTLEYAYDDYCIAIMAEKMGETKLANEFYMRSKNYLNLIDPQTKFFIPRDNKGNFINEYAKKANSFQYQWSVQQDIEGLINIIGGNQSFEERLDSLFTNSSEDLNNQLNKFGVIGDYVHSNMLFHHVAYLYNKVRKPWKTQKYVSQIMNDFYHNTPGGIAGDEGNGQKSAWYVFSALGFYPVNPVSGEYEIGTPLFPEVKFHLDNGNTFKVIAHNLNKENIFIRSVKVDGIPYHKSYITHDIIMKGSTLEFDMCSDEGYIWY